MSTQGKKKKKEAGNITEQTHTHVLQALKLFIQSNNTNIKSRDQVVVHS